ncbi:universal stress protein [Flagellimonas algicola]|uniref:Universal stress protein n=1 Tax=Flagellimonas algicola TaxID=2583815 RepID=A0ABY2WJV8_9FLAO|nr:universal stress protein [Allomuricauda algicola]TMU55120.1 universal stress protein [Allomuricauda algicola]
MNAPFKTVLFGFAFSPTLRANILETSRIAHFFGAKLILLHVGEKTAKKEARIKDILSIMEHQELEVSIQWKTGKPDEVLLATCQESNIDLLILGAMQHENLYQFYVGSIARKLTRKVCCSVLLLIKPSEERVPCQHVVVNGLEDEDTPLAISNACYVSHALGAKRLTIVEEIGQKEVAVEITDDKSLKKATIQKERLKHREDSRVRKILKSVPGEHLENLKVKTQSIFGKHGYSIGHYAEVIRADLLVMNAPKKIGLLDRIFPHDIEYILSDLPTDLLIVRKTS